ncbi:restriction endonuclease subunit S [bacterium]|nr:restriction endonuclease subunit S [bacterium]
MDRLIEQTEALIEKYRRVKQGMMADLLSRGVDEHGKLRPTQKQAPQLYKQSELGWIPKEWEVERLEDVSRSLITYGIVQPGPHVVGGVPFVQTKNLTKGVLNVAAMDRTSKTIAESYQRSAVATGDIVCGIRATVGITLEIPPSLDGANISRGVARLSPKSEYNKRYILWALRSVTVQGAIDREVKGTTYAEVTLPALRGVKVMVPRRAEQDRVADVITSCDDRIGKETLHLTKLRTLKTGLMQDLLTGKVRVKVDNDEEATADV